MLNKILNSGSQLDVRGYAVVSLGWIGKPEAIPKLLELLRKEPEIKWTAESLVRLDAVGHAPLFGADIRKGSSAERRGFGKCVEKEPILDGEYLGRTVCRTLGNEAELAFFADAPDGAIDGDNRMWQRANHASD